MYAFIFSAIMLFMTTSVSAPSYNYALTESNSQFAIDLYHQLTQTEQGNLFFSPYSISSALAMTYAGARGKTAEEMAKVMYFDALNIHGAFQQLQMHLNTIETKGDITLHIANALWPQKDYSFLEEYIDLIKKNYNSFITPLDYKTQTEAARQTINHWVEEKTNNKIKELLPEDALTTLTRLVLVNAIYFKGNWAKQFHTSSTINRPFSISETDKIQVPTMQTTDSFTYGEGKDYQLLKLPYQGEDLSMVIILPKQIAGLEALESKLDAGYIKNILKQAYMQKIMVLLPKFTFASTLNLKEVFIAMGMKEAFDEFKANFAGMDGREDGLYINEIFHKAFIEVNEEGTEAAAATGVVMMQRTSIALPPPVFKADHPFIFMIMDEKTQSILFMGRMTNPLEE